MRRNVICNVLNEFPSDGEMILTLSEIILDKLVDNHPNSPIDCNTATVLLPLLLLLLLLPLLLQLPFIRHSLVSRSCQASFSPI